MKIVVVQVIDKNDNHSCGRYTLPKEEYDAFVKYLTKKITTDVVFKIIGRSLKPDEFRPWRFM
jgi:hypothetical protein